MTRFRMKSVRAREIAALALPLARVAVATPLMALGVSMVCANLETGRPVAALSQAGVASSTLHRLAPPAVIALATEAREPRALGGAKNMRAFGGLKPQLAPTIDVAATAADVVASVRGPTSARLLRQVRVGDDLRLLSDGVAYQLADIAPVGPAAMCRRLDGVSESCRERAATRLELVMRGRAVECRVVATAQAGAALARCAAGKIDLASDLVRNGLARRLS
jgi:endonuclease YncB( thermonuclease family)